MAHLARGRVDGLPGILAAHDEVGHQHRADGGVGHAVAGVAGDDVHIAVIHRIAAEVGQPVGRLHDLARPAVFHGTRHRETVPRPAFQFVVAMLRMVILPDLVVRPADDENVVVRLRAALLGPDVIVGVAGIPEQDGRYRILRHAQSDDVGAVASLLRMHDHAVIERRVGGNDDGICPDLAAGCGHGLHPGIPVHAERPRPAVHAPAITHDSLGQASQVLQRMELRLVAEMDAASGIESQAGHTFQQFDIGACPLRCVKLLVDVACAERVEVAADAFESAIDLLVPDDGFDLRDRLRIGVRDELRSLFAEAGLDVCIPFIRRKKMRGGAPGLPGAHTEGIDDHDAATLPAKKIGSRQPGNAGADHADIGLDITRQRRKIRHGSRRHPYRSGYAIACFQHDSSFLSA
ncbi:hypothetical protein AYR66_15410 [Noviherbaspirillum denitrificans]|uniref:Uncharacterized protein n=1 Tax=Noviherbaspirillum denitrificans TaxID=1968433 RepID=A0A254TDH9_9BURK|nr:hypothetical protein AYR66_15410 [Noviherbaspirillum denitrificans]